MRRNALTAFVLAATFCAPGGLSAQIAKAPAKERVVKIGKHLRVNLHNRQVIVNSEVCLRSGALELLLCGWGSKEHESVLHTRAKASHVHAALLLLGLAPGKPAEWIMVEDQQEGRTLPPRGAGLDISLRWTDKNGTPRALSAAKFLAVGNKKGAAAPKEWIFVGSDIFPDGRYWADSEGEIICVANFASAVIDVPFGNPNKLAQQVVTFMANTAAIPPAGTPVEVIITPRPGAEKAPHARATLEIDARGRFRLDGRPILRHSLRNEASTFIDHHQQGMVVIQASPSAIVADVVYARDELTLGGVHRIGQKWIGIGQPILPKTLPQKAHAMEKWREKFANPRDFIVEPSQDADEELIRIRAALADLKTRRDLIEKYQAELQKARQAYIPTTQPAVRSRE